MPVRWAGDRDDVLDRLSFLLLDDRRPAGVEVLVVDDGSLPEQAAVLQSTCERHGFSYYHVDSELSVFSIGRARNAGAQQARGEFVMFMDVDLMPYRGYFQDVLDEIEVQNLRDNAERFLMFGVIYLTSGATDEFRATPEHLRRGKFIQYLLEDDKSRIEKFSTGTSVTVWHRMYFLATGGNDPDFGGWGFEDLEYMCRAIRRAKRFALPQDFALDYRNFQTINEYRGWKATYRLFGDMTFQKGMVLFHAWHPVGLTGDYVKARGRNRKLFEQKLAAFKERGEEPSPLPMPERGRSLLFRTNPWVYNRWIAPALGDIVVVDEEMLTPDSCLGFIRSHDIDRVVFHNPYATERMHALYDCVRREGVEFLVCERGALPGSVFFDPCGFNGESSSYAPERWRHPLTPAQAGAIVDYVQRLRAGEDCLEEQPSRVGERALRQKLGLPPNERILFVPLQRPSDTVISHLCGPIGGYEEFLTMVKRLAFTLPPNWTIVAKRHPLEVESPPLPGVVFANDVHIHDMVEAADALLLINSGVGVLGIAHEKPVFHAGLAFYGHPGLSHPVSTHEDVLAALETFKPDRSALLQFLHYLVFEFYSFASFKTRRIPWKDGGMMTATTAIDYHVARVPGCPALCLERRDLPEIPRTSVLFDRYRNAPGAAPRLSPPPSKANPTGGGQAASPKAIARAWVPDVSSPLFTIRKLNKLRTDPVRFLCDSRFGLLRTLGRSVTHLS